MNSIMERWVQTCRRELLDRTLIYNQRHLLHALRQFEQFYNGNRPHQGIANARPLCPLPPQITDQDMLAHLNVRRQPPRRHPSRVRARGVTCADEIFGKCRLETWWRRTSSSRSLAPSSRASWVNVCSTWRSNRYTNDAPMTLQPDSRRDSKAAQTRTSGRLT
jgi:hypothetical protein